MSTLRVSACLLCEGVRPELHRKAMIFGFYGVAPDVTVVVRDLGAPVPIITFLLTVRGPGDEVPVYARIIAPDGTTLVTTEGQPTSPVGPLPANKGALAAIGIADLTFAHPGIHQIHILFHEELVFKTSFNVEQGPID